MRLFSITLLALVSCGRTEQDSHPVRPGAGGVAAGDAGGRGSGAEARGGSPTTAGNATSAGGGRGGGGGGRADAGGASAAGEGAGGAGDSIDLTQYTCETYSLGACLDGASTESYACCPLVGNAPCVTGFQTSNGDDFRCGSDSCQCVSGNFDTSCYGTNTPCPQEPHCETVWQYEHVYQGEHPGSAFNPYYAQISLLTPSCGAIGMSLDNHRVGSFAVYGLTECWKLGTQVTSQLQLDGESGTLELLAPPITAPPFEAHGARLELDVYRVAWDDDSLLFNVSWRAIACQ